MGRLKQKLLLSGMAISILLSCSKGRDDLLKGVPMPYEEMQAVSLTDLGTEIKGGEIDIYEAYARAVKANLPSRFNKLYQIMKQDLSAVDDYTLLPKIVALSGYNVRYSNDWNGLITSKRLESTQDNNSEIDNSTLAAAINVLDFSIVYGNAKNSDNSEEMQEALKKVLIKNILHDTKVAFLKAVAGQRIKKEADNIANELTEALTYIKAVEGNPEFKEKISDYKKSLLDNLALINSLRREISDSKIRLSGLINVDPNSEFIMIVPKDIDNPYIYKDLQLNSMENFALNTRSEAKNDIYDVKINPVEIRAEVKKEFPEVEFGTGLSGIKNNYLLNQMWSTVGIKTGWNLLYLSSIDTPINMDQMELQKVRQMAIKIAVLAGVNMSYQRLEQAYQEYRIASLLNDISRDIYLKSDKFGTGVNRFDIIGRNIEWLFARLKKDYAYAELKDAESSLHVALGVESTPPINMSSSVASIARSIEERLIPTEYEDKEYEEVMDLNTASKIGAQPELSSSDAETKRRVDAWLKGQDAGEGIDKNIAVPTKVISKNGVRVVKKGGNSVNPSMNGNRLQLGSYSRPESAKKAWDTVFSKLRPLNGYTYEIKDAVVNGKKYYRLYVVGEKTDLTVICKQIQTTLKSCIIK